MQKSKIEKLVEETMSSLDGASRAEAKPFLLTRIQLGLQNGNGSQNAWSRIGSFLSNPRIALAGVLVILILNITVIMQRSGNSNSLQNTTSVKDDFAMNVVSIYDIENQEP